MLEKNFYLLLGMQHDLKKLLTLRRKQAAAAHAPVLQVLKGHSKCSSHIKEVSFLAEMSKQTRSAITLLADSFAALFSLRLFSVLGHTGSNPALKSGRTQDKTNLYTYI